MVGFNEKFEGDSIAAKDISMQIAAMNPLALNEDSIDSETIEKELDIIKGQLKDEGKPENMIEKIAEGKMKRFYKDNTLVNQSFIKDSKISVSQYLSNYSSNIYITSFGRVSIG